jgi:molecular chaperone GrpE
MNEDRTRPEDQAEPGPGGGAAQDAASAAAATPEPPAPTPEERLAALEVERDEMRDRLLRLAADFDNFKKRARKELAEAEAKGKEAILRDLLEVVDNLERAASVGESADVKAIQQGVGLVLRLFQSKLERHDVRPFEAKGREFDPRLHDAISQVPSADVPPGSVLSELQRGYHIGERLLRPAMVVVALPPPAAAGAREPAGPDGKSPAAAGGDGQSPGDEPGGSDGGGSSR